MTLYILRGMLWPIVCPPSGMPHNVGHSKIQTQGTAISSTYACRGMFTDAFVSL